MKFSNKIFDIAKQINPAAWHTDEFNHPANSLAEEKARNIRIYSLREAENLGENK